MTMIRRLVLTGACLLSLAVAGYGAAALWFVSRMHRFECEAMPPPCGVDHSGDWMLWTLGGAIVAAGIAGLVVTALLFRRGRRAMSER